MEKQIFRSGERVEKFCAGSSTRALEAVKPHTPGVGCGPVNGARCKQRLQRRVGEIPRSYLLVIMVRLESGEAYRVKEVVDESRAAVSSF